MKRVFVTDRALFLGMKGEEEVIPLVGSVGLVFVVVDVVVVVVMMVDIGRSRLMLSAPSDLCQELIDIFVKLVQALLDTDKARPDIRVDRVHEHLVADEVSLDFVALLELGRFGRAQVARAGLDNSEKRLDAEIVRVRDGLGGHGRGGSGDCSTIDAHCARMGCRRGRVG